MDLGIAGRRALVMGASKGIGRGIAAELAAEGARVAVSSRERIEGAAAAIGATPFVHDSADLDGVGALLDAVGPLDLLVTNTGGPPASPDPLSFGRNAWEEAYRTLVLAPMAVVERTLPGMRERARCGRRGPRGAPGHGRGARGRRRLPLLGARELHHRRDPHRRRRADALGVLSGARRGG